MQIHQRLTGIIYPWDVFNYLWNENKLFSFISGRDDDPDRAAYSCADYWEHVNNLDFYQDLNISMDDRARTIPLAVHVDGVKVYRTHKAWVYSWGSMLHKGNSLHSKVLLLLIRDADLVKNHSHDAVGRLMGWIFEVLQSGVFPLTDCEGRPWPLGSLQSQQAGTYFAGGWRAAFSAFKADLEARVQVHKLVRNWSSNSICEHCLASKKPDFSYGDFSNNAAYLECMLSHEQFLLLNPPERQSSWTCVKGWRKERNLEATLMI